MPGVKKVGQIKQEKYWRCVHCNDGAKAFRKSDIIRRNCPMRQRGKHVWIEK